MSLEHGKQMGGRVGQNETVAIECRVDGIGSCEPELGFQCGVENHWKL